MESSLPTKRRPGRPPGKQPGVYNRYREQILSRLKNGEELKEIAHSLGVTQAALSAPLRADPEYIQSREDGTESQLSIVRGIIKQAAQNASDAVEKDDPEAAGANLTLARTAEILARRIEWKAEREFPHRWGQRTHTVVEHVGDLADKLRRARERVVATQTQVNAANGQVEDAQVVESTQLVQRKRV